MFKVKYGPKNIFDISNPKIINYGSQQAFNGFFRSRWKKSFHEVITVNVSLIYFYNISLRKFAVLCQNHEIY